MCVWACVCVCVCVFMCVSTNVCGKSTISSLKSSDYWLILTWIKVFAKHSVVSVKEPCILQLFSQKSPIYCLLLSETAVCQCANYSVVSAKEPCILQLFPQKRPAYCLLFSGTAVCANWTTVCAKNGRIRPFSRSTKEPYITYTKYPYASAKEPYTSTNEPYTAMAMV